jgi:hypothetical protein
MNDSANSLERLAAARSASQPGSRTPHTVVVLPSYSVGDSMLATYGHRIPALEHRQLLSWLMLPRVPGVEMVFLTCLRPARQVLDYYLSLVPPAHRRDMRARLRIVDAADPSPRSLSAKLLERPDLIDQVRRLVRHRVAYIEPWNVTETETELARRLDLPLNGTAPDLWRLGFKSSGRKIMRAAGVPLPVGAEDVRSVEDVVSAAEAIREQRPGAAGFVIKTDNNSSGNGNRVVRFGSGGTAAVRAAVESLEPWYLAELACGGVVEELLTGAGFASPSVQVDLAPDGTVEVLSTHEQVLNGDESQVYSGCRFPAAQEYSRDLAAYGAAVGRVLAERGALGRFSVDFAAVRSTSGTWSLHGLEINLRKSGTNHPLSLLHSLVPGCYDPAAGCWLAADGFRRCYISTDNLVDARWLGRSPGEVICAVRSAGLEFDRQTRTGVVLHMFSGLGIDGRLGLTAIGKSTAEAALLYDAAVAALYVPASGGLLLPA